MDCDSPLRKLESQIETLEEEKKRLELQELYSDADSVSKKLSELKAKLKKNQLSILKSFHNKEKDDLEKTYQDELQNFNNKWNSIIESYVEKCNVELEDFNQNHHQSKAKEKQKLESTLFMFFKPSSTLLNLIKCKEKAVRSGKYAEAQTLLNQIEEAKNFEEARFSEQKRLAVEQGLVNFEQVAEKKLQNLKKRSSI